MTVGLCLGGTALWGGIGGVWNTVVGVLIVNVINNGMVVIGLPGCARAPALNGADWILSRVACGVAVTDDDIAGMGVGGLLKEIPTRPQPRRPKR